MKIGYHFYTSIHFLQSNELSQYCTLPGLLHVVVLFEEAVHFTTLYISYYQGYHQSPYRTEANQISHAFEDAH